MANRSQRVVAAQGQTGRSPESCSNESSSHFALALTDRKFSGTLVPKLAPDFNEVA